MCRVVCTERFTSNFTFREGSYRESTRECILHVIVGSLKGDRKVRCSLKFHPTPLIPIFDLFQGKDLPAKDLSGTSDPYVRVTLLPDKKHRLETKIKRRTLNPRWNETFYFEGEHAYFGNAPRIGPLEHNFLPWVKRRE